VLKVFCLHPNQCGADYTQKINKILQIVDTYVIEGQCSRLSD